MKKIIAFLSVLVMTIAMSATSFAADNEVVFNPTKGADGTSVTIDVSLKTTYTDIQTIGLFLNVADAVDAGATVTTTNGDAQLKYVGPQKMVSLAFAPSDLHKYVSGTSLGTITITGISEDFDVSLMAKTSRTTSKITSVADGDLMYGSTVAFDPAAISTTIVMKEAEVGKTVAFTADLAAIEGTKYMFSVADETADLKADTDAFEFVTDIAAAESVTVGLIIENVPVDNVLSAMAKLVF